MFSRTDDLNNPAAKAGSKKKQNALHHPLLNKISEYCEDRKGDSITDPKILEREVRLLPVRKPISSAKYSAAKQVE